MTTTRPFLPPRTAHALRRCVFFAHLWVGLILGLYFVVMGLTGSLLLFENELDAVTHRSLFAVSAPAGRTALPLDTLAAAVTLRHPGATINSLALPQSPGQSLRVGFAPPTQGQSQPRGGRGGRLEAFVNPYTGAILGERPAGGTFFPWVLRLHRQFLLDDVGQTLNRCGVLFLIVLLVSGLWLWWPSAQSFARQFRQRTTLQRGSSQKRLVFDIHNMVGFYSSLLLLVISVTAASYFWKPQTIGIVSTLTGTPMVASSDGPGVVGGPKGRDGGGRQRQGGGENGRGTATMSYAAVLLSAGKVFPKLPVLQIGRGRGGRGGLRVTKAMPEAYGVRPRLITLTINDRDGSLTSVDLPGGSPLGVRVMSWLMPIHEGQWGYGWTYYIVKALHLLAGLSPLVLFVTGVLMYLNKRRGKIENEKKRRAREAVSAPVPEAVSA